MLTETIKLVAACIALLTVVLSFTKKSDAPQAITVPAQNRMAKVFRGIVFSGLIVGMIVSYFCDGHSMVELQVWTYVALIISMAFLFLPFSPSKGDIWIFVFCWVMTGVIGLGVLVHHIDDVLRAVSKTA